MRDTAAVRRWFAGLALLDQLHAEDRDLLAEHAEWVRVGCGERVHGEDEPGTALWFLVEGEIILGGQKGGAADGVVRRAVTTPGYPVGWDGMVWPGRHRWDAVAGSPARLLRVPRGVIDDAGCAGRRLRGPVFPVPAVAGGGPAAWAAHPPRHRPLRRRDRRGRRAHHVPRGRAARDLRAAPHPRLPAFAPDRRRRFPGAGGDSATARTPWRPSSRARRSTCSRAYVANCGCTWACSGCTRRSPRRLRTSDPRSCGPARAER